MLLHIENPLLDFVLNYFPLLIVFLLKLFVLELFINPFVDLGELIIDFLLGILVCIAIFILYTDLENTI